MKKTTMCFIISLFMIVPSLEKNLNKNMTKSDFINQYTSNLQMESNEYNSFVSYSRPSNTYNIIVQYYFTNINDLSEEEIQNQKDKIINLCKITNEIFDKYNIDKDDIYIVSRDTNNKTMGQIRLKDCKFMYFFKEKN